MDTPVEDTPNEVVALLKALLIEAKALNAKFPELPAPKPKKAARKKLSGQDIRERRASKRDPKYGQP